MRQAASNTCGRQQATHAQAAVTYKQQRDNNFNNASGLKIHNETEIVDNKKKTEQSRPLSS
jgi:hypothetical protein